LMNAVSWPSGFPLSLLGGIIPALQTSPVQYPIKLAGVVIRYYTATAHAPLSSMLPSNDQIDDTFAYWTQTLPDS
jgi:hypothetical protein